MIGDSMKKTKLIAIITLLLMIALVALVACGPATPPEENVPPSSVTDPEGPSDPTDPEKPDDPTDPYGPSDPTDPDEPSDPTDPDEPSYDEMPECEEYWCYEPTDKVGKLVKVSYDAEGNIRLVEKYPLFTEFEYSSLAIGSTVSLANIEYNDPFGTVTERIEFNYIDGELVSSDYYYLSRNHLGDRTLRKGYTTRYTASTDSLSYKYVTADVYEGGMKTRITDTYFFDELNNEIIKSSQYSSDEAVYDMTGRLIAIRGNRDGSIFEYGTDGNISSCIYTVTGTAEKEILFTFEAGRLASISCTEGAEKNSATLTYDSEGRFVRADIDYTNSASPSMNASGVSSVVYDGSGRVTSITHANARDGEAITREYTYTASGSFATVGDYITYTYRDGRSELISYALTYEGSRPVSISKTNGASTYTSQITYDSHGNITFDGSYTYEYYSSGALKKKTGATGYTVYYENGLPKEAEYPGIERSTVTNYFNETSFNFAFALRDMYFEVANETSSLLGFAKRTVHVAADGTVTEYVRTFDENFNITDTTTTVTPPSEVDPPASHTHEYTRVETTTAATCTEDGLLTKYCSCGDSITEVIKAKGHKYNRESIIKYPTCTESGEKKLSCSCGDFVTESIKPVDHSYDEYSELTAPTCEGDGVAKLSCICGKFITEPIPATGHDIVDEQITKEPTCVMVGIVTKYCSVGCVVTEEIEPNGHSWRDWSTETEPTCESEGRLLRSCEVCFEIEYFEAPVIPHSYSKVIEGESADGQPTVSLVCDMCDKQAGEVYLGSYLDTNGIFYLTEQPTDFGFELLTDWDIEAVRGAVVLTEVFLLGCDEEEVRKNAIELSVTESEHGRYRVTPVSPLDENSTYAVIIYEYDGAVRFSDMPGNSFVFDTEGDAVSNVEYNKDVIFLKAVAEARSIEYAYSLEYNDEYGVHLLVLSEDFGFTEEQIGKIIFIGDATSFDEADGLSSDEIFIGKIEGVVFENGLCGIGLSTPSVLDIYSKIEVSGAGINNVDESIVTEEVKRRALRNVIESDDFASAVAAANIAARNYVRGNFSTLRAIPRSIDLGGFKVTAEVEKISEKAVKIALYITYSHVIDLCEGDIPLGDISFAISFEISNTFELDVDTNLSEYFSDRSTPMMFMKCQVISTTLAAFDISAGIEMNYSEMDEALFVVNITSEKIHHPSCTYIPKILTDNYILLTLGELESYNKHYKDFECKVCCPFSVDSSTFYVNRDSWTVHVNSCYHLDDMIAENYIAYSMYPVGIGITDCNACHPERYTKTLAQHVGESLKDKDFSEAFESVKKALGDVLVSGGESPIDEDTEPKILIPIACFEVPIYLEPKFDFSLKADFKLHSEVSVVNSTVLAMVYRDGNFSIIGDYHDGKPTSVATVDITGELDIELGVIAEIRFGLRYLSKHVYVGLMMDAGVYLDAGGVFSYDTNVERAYYAASLELGAYAEVRCTYAIIGLVDADSFYVIDKTHFPAFSSGDTRVYFRYDNMEQTMSIVNVRKLWLDNGYLMCNYYDLKKMEIARGSLSWQGSEQYEITCMFSDKDGNTVDYIVFENGALRILEGAPDEFTVYMTVSVTDKIAYDTFEEYFGISNKNGYAIFLPEKVIEINYSYTDTTEDMENALDVYRGTYTFGTDMFGGDYYRNLTIGVHKAEELCADEGMLKAYAIYASFALLDENGNPKKVYSADDIRSMIESMACEYVMVSHATPGNHPFDEGREFKIVQAYWDDGLMSNSANQTEISGEASDYVYLDLGIPTDEGMFGGAYSDGSLAERVGDFEIYRTSDNNAEAE